LSQGRQAQEGVRKKACAGKHVQESSRRSEADPPAVVESKLMHEMHVICFQSDSGLPKTPPATAVIHSPISRCGDTQIHPL
jgi:hypothetical protein